MRLLDAYPNEWIRLREEVGRIAKETGLRLELESVFVRGDHLVASYLATEGRSSTVLFWSTPIDSKVKRPNRCWWHRGDAA